MNEAKAELNWIYEAIGNNELECNDAVLARINVLENIANPFMSFTQHENAEAGCGCDHPDSCWDCAAIRGGCPEDV